LLGDEFDCEKEITHTTPNGITIVGHCDAVHRATKTGIEFKTTESTKVAHEPYSYHLRQLMMYLAILGYSKGILLYLIVGSTHKISDYFPEYHLTMTENERHNMLQRIQKDATELQKGLDNKDPDLVGHVLENFNYINRGGNNWYCESCPYKKMCAGYKEPWELPEVEIEKSFTQLRQRFASLQRPRAAV
jgi:hypothetical protein